MASEEVAPAVRRTDGERRSRRRISALAYMLNPVLPVWLLCTRKYNSAFVEFHAWNALYLFSGWVLLWFPASTVLVLAARVVQPEWAPVVVYWAAWLGVSAASALAAASGALWKIPIVTRLAMKQVHHSWGEWVEGS